MVFECFWNFRRLETIYLLVSQTTNNFIRITVRLFSRDWCAIEIAVHHITSEAFAIATDKFIEQFCAQSPDPN